MLQPDEIIISKEWHQLNDAEKESLKELAGSEAEYNLVKKMLMVSAEETDEVPKVSDAVYQHIITQLPARKINTKKYWYAAAAILVIALSASLFLLKNDHKEEFVKTPDSSKPDTTIKADNLVVQQQPDSISTIKTTDTVSNKLLVQSVNKNITLKNPAPVFNIPDTVLQDTYVIQTAVNADPSLLNFITEAE